MKYREAFVITTMSVRECADVFQAATINLQSLGSKVGGTLQRARGWQGLEYFTPTNDSPFASLDDSPPSFSIGVIIPGVYMSGNQALHMYVMDRGDRRDVQLHAPHRYVVGKGSKELKLLRSYCGEFVVADPDATAVLDDGTLLAAGAADPAVPVPPDPPDVVEVAAQWSADPTGRHQLRYWNGHRWTEHVSDAGVTSIDQP